MTPRSPLTTPFASSPAHGLALAAPALTALALAALALFALPSCSSGRADAAPSTPQAEKPDEVVPVRTARVETTDAPLPIRVAGVVSAKEDQRLAFKIGGVLERVLVEEGATVREGQTLAVLALSEIDAEVHKAENGLAKATRDLERVTKLADAKVATLEQRQDAETGFEVAKSQLEIARFNRRFAAITAPAGGRVSRRLASAGELVGPGQPIFVLSATGKGWIVRAALPDRDFVRLHLGDLATFTIDALPGRTWTAKVTELAPAPSPMSGTYDVELRVDGRPEGLVVGLYAKAVITPSERARLTWIPAESVLEADGLEATVLALSDDRRSVRRVKVTTARFERDRIGVSAGLDGVREVITAGAPYLGAETPFRIVTAAGAQAAR